MNSWMAKSFAFLLQEVSKRQLDDSSTAAMILYLQDGALPDDNKSAHKDRSGEQAIQDHQWSSLP